MTGRRRAAAWAVLAVVVGGVWLLTRGGEPSTPTVAVPSAEPSTPAPAAAPPVASVEPPRERYEGGDDLPNPPPATATSNPTASPTLPTWDTTLDAFLTAYTTPRPAAAWRAAVLPHTTGYLRTGLGVADPADVPDAVASVDRINGNAAVVTARVEFTDGRTATAVVVYDGQAWAVADLTPDA